MGSSKSTTLPTGPVKKRNKFGRKSRKSLAGEDNLSKLPDEILVSILSFLTITEAGRTSLLSHRWKKLWISYHGVLDFETPKRLYNVREEGWLEERIKYIHGINQALDALRLSGRSSMNAFTVRCDQWNWYNKTVIDKFVEFAITKTFPRLEFDLSPDKHVSMWGNPYTFPSKFYDWIKQPCGLDRISSLTSLTLVNINVTGEFIEHILFNCPLIERLCVVGSRKLSNLKVEALNLKYLEIECFGVKILEVYAPNLMSLYVIGHAIKLHIEDSSKLAEVSIGYDHIASMLTSISSYPSQLQTLLLDFDLKANSNRNFTQSAVLNQLKHLIMRITMYGEASILGWTSLITASPFLQKFTLEGISFPDYTRKLRQIGNVSSTHSHECLKVVEFIGFSGVKPEIELAMYFLQNATKLEQIVIDRRYPCNKRSRCVVDKDPHCWDVKKERGLQLKKHLPPGVKFVLI